MQADKGKLFIGGEEFEISGDIDFDLKCTKPEEPPVFLPEDMSGTFTLQCKPEDVADLITRALLGEIRYMRHKMGILYTRKDIHKSMGWRKYLPYWMIRKKIRAAATLKLIKEDREYGN